MFHSTDPVSAFSLPPIVRARARECRDNIKRSLNGRKWQTVDLDERQPFAVIWFGDLHADDDNCNWPLLLQHLEIARRPGVYAAHVGDATNNWVGRLMRLYAEQSTSRDEARKLCRWLMRDAGVPWLFWLLGNHDAWESGDAIAELMSDGVVPLYDWEARLRFRAAGQEWLVHAAHDFPGNSMWNIVHGPGRAARMSSMAELLICGHKHDWGVGSFELAGHDRVVHTIRARGYKWSDKHALVNGFQQSTNGAAVMTIFNPSADSAAGRILSFPDPVAGAAVLEAMRSSGRTVAREAGTSVAAGRKASKASPRSRQAPPQGKSSRSHRTANTSRASGKKRAGSRAAASAS